MAIAVAVIFLAGQVQADGDVPSSDLPSVSSSDRIPWYGTDENGSVPFQLVARATLPGEDCITMVGAWNSSVNGSGEFIVSMEGDERVHLWRPGHDPINSSSHLIRDAEHLVPYQVGPSVRTLVVSQRELVLFNTTSVVTDWSWDSWDNTTGLDPVPVRMGPGPLRYMSISEQENKLRDALWMEVTGLGVGLDRSGNGTGWGWHEGPVVQMVNESNVTVNVTLPGGWSSNSSTGGFAIADRFQITFFGVDGARLGEWKIEGMNEVHGLLVLDDGDLLVSAGMFDHGAQTYTSRTLSRLEASNGSVIWQQEVTDIPEWLGYVPDDAGPMTLTSISGTSMTFRDADTGVISGSTSWYGTTEPAVALLDGSVLMAYGVDSELVLAELTSQGVRVIQTIGASGVTEAVSIIPGTQVVREGFVESVPPTPEEWNTTGFNVTSALGSERGYPSILVGNATLNGTVVGVVVAGGETLAFSLTPSEIPRPEVITWSEDDGSISLLMDTMLPDTFELYLPVEPHSTLVENPEFILTGDPDLPEYIEVWGWKSLAQVKDLPMDPDSRFEGINYTIMAVPTGSDHPVGTISEDAFDVVDLQGVPLSYEVEWNVGIDTLVGSVSITGLDRSQDLDLILVARDLHNRYSFSEPLLLPASDIPTSVPVPQVTSVIPTATSVRVSWELPESSSVSHTTVEVYGVTTMAPEYLGQRFIPPILSSVLVDEDGPLDTNLVKYVAIDGPAVREATISGLSAGGLYYVSVLAENEDRTVMNRSLLLGFVTPMALPSPLELDVERVGSPTWNLDGTGGMGLYGPVVNLTLDPGSMLDMGVVQVMLRAPNGFVFPSYHVLRPPGDNISEPLNLTDPGNTDGTTWFLKDNWSMHLTPWSLIGKVRSLEEVYRSTHASTVGFSDLVNLSRAAGVEPFPGQEWPYLDLQGTGYPMDSGSNAGRDAISMLLTGGWSVGLQVRGVSGSGVELWGNTSFMGGVFSVEFDPTGKGSAAADGLWDLTEASNITLPSGWKVNVTLPEPSSPGEEGGSSVIPPYPSWYNATRLIFPDGISLILEPVTGESPIRVRNGSSPALMDPAFVTLSLDTFIPLSSVTVELTAIPPAFSEREEYAALFQGHLNTSRGDTFVSPHGSGGCFMRSDGSLLESSPVTMVLHGGTVDTGTSDQGRFISRNTTEFMVIPGCFLSISMIPVPANDTGLNPQELEIAGAVRVLEERPLTAFASAFLSHLGPETPGDLPGNLASDNGYSIMITDDPGPIIVGRRNLRRELGWGDNWTSLERDKSMGISSSFASSVGGLAGFQTDDGVLFELILGQNRTGPWDGRMLGLHLDEETTTVLIFEFTGEGVCTLTNAGTADPFRYSVAWTGGGTFNVTLISYSHRGREAFSTGDIEVRPEDIATIIFDTRSLQQNGSSLLMYDTGSDGSIDHEGPLVENADFEMEVTSAPDGLLEGGMLLPLIIIVAAVGLGGGGLVISRKKGGTPGPDGPPPEGWYGPDGPPPDGWYGPDGPPPEGWYGPDGPPPEGWYGPDGPPPEGWYGPDGPPPEGWYGPDGPPPEGWYGPDGPPPDGQYPGQEGFPDGQYPGQEGFPDGQYPGQEGFPDGQYPGQEGFPDGQYPGQEGFPEGQYPGQEGFPEGQYPGQEGFPEGQYPGQDGSPEGQYPGQGDFLEGQYPGQQMSGGGSPGPGTEQRCPHCGSSIMPGMRQCPTCNNPVHL